MGELAHELESLITRIESGFASADAGGARRGAGSARRALAACASCDRPRADPHRQPYRASIARIQSRSPRVRLLAPPAAPMPPEQPAPVAVASEVPLEQFLPAEEAAPIAEVAGSSRKFRNWCLSQPRRRSRPLPLRWMQRPRALQPSAEWPDPEWPSARRWSSFPRDRSVLPRSRSHFRSVPHVFATGALAVGRAVARTRCCPNPEPALEPAAPLPSQEPMDTAPELGEQTLVLPPDEQLRVRPHRCDQRTAGRVARARGAAAPGTRAGGRRRTRRDGARECGAARSAAQQCRRGQHFARARLEQQLGSIEFNLGELSRTVTRLKEQLRKLEIETEAQILHRHENETGHKPGIRSAGTGPLFGDPAVLARPGGIGQRRRQHPGLLESLIAGGAESAAAAIAHGHGAAERPDAHAHGVAAAPRAAAGAHRAPGAAIPASAPNSSSRAPPASSTGRCWSACCRPSSTCCAMRWSTASNTRSSDAPRARKRPGISNLSLRREGAEVIVEVRDDGAGMNLQAIRDKGLELG
jgi:hypothetical protein